MGGEKNIPLGTPRACCDTWHDWPSCRDFALILGADGSILEAEDFVPQAIPRVRPIQILLFRVYDWFSDSSSIL